MPGTGGNTGSWRFGQYYVDDCILVELQWWPDGRRCQRVVQSLASNHFRLLGEGGVYDLPLISDLQITNWDTRLEVLGWIIDTETLTMTLPPHERGKLFERLAAWSASRASVSAKQVSKLVGFLMHISFAIRPGLFFVQRMLASVGMLPITAGADFAGRTANPGPRVVLGSKVHRDLDFGVSSLLRGSTRGGGCLPDPIYHLLERPARCALFSDAFKTAIGAFASKLECTAAMS